MTFLLNFHGKHSLKVLVALAALPALAQVYKPSIPRQETFEAGRSSTLLVDNFTLWTTSSAFLSSLAANSSSPAASFVAPQLSLSSSGMQMTGPTQDYETTGVQSLSTFSAPFTVVTEVTAIQGTGDPFEIFLASADLTQFLTVTANVNPTYHGIWANAPNISQLWQLGDQFSPPISPAFDTPYQIVIAMNTEGAATVKVKSGGAVLGTMSGLQPGTGPFYLVLVQRIGNAPIGSQVADWSSVRVALARARANLGGSEVKSQLTAPPPSWLLTECGLSRAKPSSRSGPRQNLPPNLRLNLLRETFRSKRSAPTPTTRSSRVTLPSSPTCCAPGLRRDHCGLLQTGRYPYHG